MALLASSKIGVTTLSPGDLTTLFGPSATPGDSAVFCVQRGPSSQAPLVNLGVNPAGAVTVIAATLKVSIDGGLTYVTAPSGATLDFVANPDQQFTLIPGKLYKVTFGTITGGTGITLVAGAS
jgi:hypothetical protein